MQAVSYSIFCGGERLYFFGFTEFYGVVMKRKINNLVILCVLACMVLFSAQTAFAEQTPKTVQPQALDHANIRELKNSDAGLSGSGVKFAVICRSLTYDNGEPQNDYRPLINHNCFNEKNFTFSDQNELATGISEHSTAICSILFGSDPNAFNKEIGNFKYQGIAPAAKADVYEFWHFLSNNIFTNTPPAADIITASIGNQFEDWWTRGIESMAQHHGIIVVAGIGNGTDVHDPVLYPAAGANVIGVGVVDSVNTDALSLIMKNFSLAYPEHSSTGPTVTGRCKPDIVAPGNCMAADINEPDSYKLTGNWSSFSTPIVAGTLGLLVEKAKQTPALSEAVSANGGNCVMKAVLLNSAKKLAYWHKGKLTKADDHTAPLDYIQGAGMLDAANAYKHLTAGKNEPGDVNTTGWDLNNLQKPKTENAYKITITEPAKKTITVTTAWNKHYKASYPFEAEPQKDSNFRLELWAVDSEDPDNDYLLDYSDSENDNVEHINVSADPNFTNYEIVIAGSSTDPNQTITSKYGLAWSVSETRTMDDILLYDLNADGIVNETDFALFINNMVNSKDGSQNYLLGDIDDNGTIDVNDLKIFTNHLNTKADWLPKETE